MADKKEIDWKSSIVAIKYVQGKMDQLNNQEKKLLQDVKNGKGKEEDNVQEQQEDIEEQTTTSGIF